MEKTASKLRTKHPIFDAVIIFGWIFHATKAVIYALKVVFYLEFNEYQEQ